MNLLPPPDDPYFGVLEVPNSTTTHRLTPGYAIVPDIGFTDPSKSSLAPTGRKRITAAAKTLHASSSGGAELTSRQEAAIIKHIQELDKDDSRDFKIEVPKGGGGGSGSRQQGKKTTTNVARILKSEKGFAHHLADEEAWRAQQQQSSSSSGGHQGHGHAPAKPTAGSSTPAPTKGHKPSLSKHLPTQAIASPSTSTARQQEQQQSDENLESLEADPLLRTHAPSAPSAELMDALVSAAPLSYSQARAAPSKNPTRRMYCAVCGYWGRVRCVKCGARVCGMGCKREHGAECGMMYA